MRKCIGFETMDTGSAHCCLDNTVKSNLPATVAVAQVPPACQFRPSPDLLSSCGDRLSRQMDCHFQKLFRKDTQKSLSRWHGRAQSSVCVS